MFNLLMKLTARMPCRVIEVNGLPYLERYYVGRLLGFTFYLHRFLRGDAEDHLHDHPWSSCFSVVLSGFYQEEFATCLDPLTGPVTESRFVRWFNRFGPGYFHRITAVQPGTWTLFIHGERIKGWGFLEHTPGVPGVKYVAAAPSVVDWHLQAPTGAEVRHAAK